MRYAIYTGSPMPAYEGKTQRLESPCPLCGGNAFTWGSLTANGGTYFRAEGESLFEVMFKHRGVVDARVCNACSNIQLFLPGTADNVKAKRARQPKGTVPSQEDDDAFWGP